MKIENIQNSIVSINTETGNLEKLRILTTNEYSEKLLIRALKKILCRDCEYCPENILILI